MIGLSKTEEALLNFLLEAKRISQEDARKFAQGQLRFDPFHFYVYKTLDAMGVGKNILLDQTVQKAKGATNIHQGKLKEHEYMAINRVRAAYVTDVAADEPIEENAYSPVITDWPTGLYHSELTVSQDDSPLPGLNETPLILMGSAVESFAATNKVDGLELEKPTIFEPLKQIKVELDLAVASFGANHHFIQLLFSGIRTRVRSHN